jgi:DNA-binding transcriptional LysR family regulator
MNYTLNQLRIFLKIAQTRSITRTAEEFHLTQPAVSIQLKNFQQQFDIPLVEVVNKRVFLTEFGLEIAAAAENILNEVYAINYKTMAYKGQLSGRLKISVVSTGKYVIPYFLSSFLRVNPGVELELDVTNKSLVVNSLIKNEIDFALVSVLPETLRLDKIELMPNKLFLIGQNSVAFDQLTPEALEDIPLILREEGSATRMAMERFIQNQGLKIRRKLVLTSNEAVKQSVIAGLGYSIMPLIGLRNEIINGQLKIIPVKGLPITSVWNLVRLSEKKHNPVTQAFTNFLNHEKEHIIAEHFGWLAQF